METLLSFFENTLTYGLGGVRPSNQTTYRESSDKMGQMRSSLYNVSISCLSVGPMNVTILVLRSIPRGTNGKILV